MRHGETDWNRDGRYQGHADPPLNEVGREQARELSASFGGGEVEAIYTSDLRRAAETAAIVGAALGVPVTTDRDLREVDVGSWQGLTREQLAGREWDGETRDDHRRRVLDALRRIERAHDGRVLVVTHGGSMRRVCEAAGDGERDGARNCETLACRVGDDAVVLLD